MDYSNLKSRLFYGILIVATFYLIFCIINDEKDPRLKHNKEFAEKLRLKLNTVKELDEIEKKKIDDEMHKLLNERSHLGNLTKNSVTGAIRGGLAGGLVGGVEGALAGGIAFGAMSPVILMIETML